MIRRNPDRFTVIGLAASSARMELLLSQIQGFAPSVVAVTSSSVSDLQLGMYAWAGLEPTLAALRAGSVVALATKESLIIGGDIVPLDPHGYHAHLDTKAGTVRGWYDPDDVEVWRSLAEQLRGASAVLFLGHGNGKANASHQFFDMAPKRNNPQI